MVQKEYLKNEKPYLELPYYQSINFFIAPKPILAMILMTLNDHWLKYEFPSFLTGKLSDFLGLYFTPLFLLAIFITGARFCKIKITQTIFQRWALFFIILCDVIFILIKISPKSAEIYLQVIDVFFTNGAVIQDPWDLLALLISPLSFRQALVGVDNHR